MASVVEEFDKEWVRPENSCHAHFDCFSGAAGDMMLAACLDAAGDNKDKLLRHVVKSLEEGMPELRDEFSIETKQVWRGMGSIAAMYVDVKSKYNHEAAPVPARAKSLSNDATHGEESVHDHNHDHGGRGQEPHDHSHNHQHPQSKATIRSESEQEHIHDHGHHSHAHDHHSHAHTHNHHHDDESDPNSNYNIQENFSHGVSSDDPQTEPRTSVNSQNHSHSHSHGHSHNHHSHSHSHSHESAAAGEATKGPLRNLPQIRKMLQHAPGEQISPWVKERAIAAFTALAEAEAKTHGASSIDAVHFHEVGAVDSIVDTVGTLIALDALSVSSISCSRLPLGEGTVWTDHGLLPVPAPATLRLMIGMPTCPGPSGVTGELVTPTAAALLRACVKLESASTTSTSAIEGRPPAFTIRQVGIGAGTKDFQKHPNILRLMLGDTGDTC